MRIDVRLSGDDVESELLRLGEKLRFPEQLQHTLPVLASPLPSLVFHYRECHGEFYVYAQDTANGRIAGYTVFNHVAGVNAQAGRHLRTPHSRYATAYQRRGLATAVYEWALNAGICLLSGPRQSLGAHELWRSLSASYELRYFDVRDKTLRDLGQGVDRSVLEDFHTRMMLAGAGWTADRQMTP